MPATCAICQQPIIARNDVRVSGTEVMHRACAMSGQETVGSRQSREIADLRVALATAREGARQQLIFHQKQVHRAERAEREIAEAIADRDAARAAEAAADRLVTQALRERDEARTQLAQRTQALDVSPSSEDSRDATEIRFSLLDMD